MHEGRWTHSFEIPVNHPEFVKVAHTRRDLKKLKVINEQGKGSRGNNYRGRTNRKRFASGLDVAYLIAFPLDIHSEKIWKQCGSVDTETPTRGRMFGWDRRFYHIISRHNR